jgi:hypothetical protein
VNKPNGIRKNLPKESYPRSTSVGILSFFNHIDFLFLSVLVSEAYKYMPRHTAEFYSQKTKTGFSEVTIVFAGVVPAILSS